MRFAALFPSTPLVPPATFSAPLHTAPPGKKPSPAATALPIQPPHPIATPSPAVRWPLHTSPDPTPPFPAPQTPEHALDPAASLSPMPPVPRQIFPALNTKLRVRTLHQAVPAPAASPRRHISLRSLISPRPAPVILFRMLPSLW